MWLGLSIKLETEPKTEHETRMGINEQGKKNNLGINNIAG